MKGLHQITITITITITRALSRSGMRKPYRERSDTIMELDFEHKCPVSLFTEWFNEAVACDKIFEANAMHVSTVNKLGYDSSSLALLSMNHRIRRRNHSLSI